MSETETTRSVADELAQSENQEVISDEEVVEDNMIDNTAVSEIPRSDELNSLKLPVNKLSKTQREKIIKEYAEQNNHPYYYLKPNKNGVMMIRKRKQTVEQEIAELHPGSSLSQTQLLQAQIINLERKYIKLENKHKKLKRRVNIIDNETLVIDDDDMDLTPKAIPEETSRSVLVADERSQPEPVYEPVIDENTFQQNYIQNNQFYGISRQPRRSLKSLFR